MNPPCLSQKLTICLALVLCGCGLTSVRSQNIGNANETLVTPMGNTNANATAVAATPRRFAYSVNLRMRAVYDDNIFLTQQCAGG